jgi:hypothetical protein
MKHSILFSLAVVLGLSLAGFSYGADDSCCSTKSTVDTKELIGKVELDVQSPKSEMSCCSNKGGEKGGEAHASGQKGKMMGGKGGKAVMQKAHTLVFNYESLERKVEEIPGGVRTTSTTTDPALVAVLQKHPREMDSHLENGGHVRKWDPLFGELAKHHDKVTMVFKDLENGIEVTSTSDDPDVTLLIRAHAYKVSEFVKRGRDAMHESTPLPEGYESN